MHLVRWGMLAMAVGGILASAGLAVGQQPAEEAKKCVQLESSPDQGIEVCTRVINSGAFKDRALAVLHLARGNMWVQKGDVDKAIADYDAATNTDGTFAGPFINRAGAWLIKGDADKALAEINKAISLDPKNPGSFNERARIWLLKGEPSRAAADLDAAVRFDPNFIPAYGARGRAKFYRGQFAEAATDLAHFASKTQNPYALIWVALAKSRQSQDGKAELDQAAAMVKPNAWPTPLIQLFQGKLDRAGVMAAIAKSGQAKTDQTCEAEFYLGEQAQLQGRKEDAQQSFKRAAEICPKNFVEYDGAVAELKNLAK